MKTQLLVYRKQGCGFAETTDLTIREFSNASAFDAFELTVIDLQDENLWNSDYDSDKLLKNHADISSIRQMMALSKKSKCIVLLPKNYIYSHEYGYNYSIGSSTYLKNSPLKNIISNFKESPIGELFLFSMPVCFGESKTNLSDVELSSDFSFAKPLPFGADVILESNASTVTAVLISEAFAATTLMVNNFVELSAIVDAVFPPEVQPSLTPDWLDEVGFHDETVQRARVKEIDEQMAVLNEEKKGIEKILSSYRDIKSVLCTKDSDLENNARHLLAEIAEVDETFEDNKEEDFNFSYDDTFYLIEIKGSSRGLKRQHISKTYDHVQIKMDEMEAEGDSRKIKGVLIFASQIELRPEERDPFPEKQISIAQRTEIAVLSTETLLRCYEAHIEERLTSDAFKETLRHSSGLISPDAFGLHG